MSEIDGIGSVIAYNVSEFFARERNRAIVTKLKDVGVLTEPQPRTQNRDRYQTKFCINRCAFFDA
jgi:NAD-dependent DNA ligase